MSADRTAIPAPQLEPGQQVEGFRIEAVTPLEEIRARCYEAVHLQTGAQVLLLHCHDEEKLFAVGFLTPAEDSRGTPHVLEHCVLAGSERFPVKDAFAELERRSLATFLNAFTWPDRTIYPVCSAVRADYENLASVYCDLVLRPRLLETTFAQEGVHLAPEDEGQDPPQRFVWSGVVYNEMRGAYSSPEQLVERALSRALRPDTCYRHDAGGEPDEIPLLTHQALVEFHRRAYAPRAARFLLYGDVPPRDNLALLARLLAGLQPGPPPPAVPALQPPWPAPRELQLRYPVAAGAETARRSFCVLAWLCCPVTEVAEALWLQVLVEALVGSAAGPLRKALIDSGLGEDLYPPHACETETLQLAVRFGLRGTEPEHAGAIEQLVLGTLARLAEQGLDRELLEASLHQVELAGREIVPPFPILLLSRASRLWYYGADPKDGLRFGEQLAALRRRLAAEPDLPERTLRRWLLDNPHRLRLVARPDPELFVERERALRARLAELSARLDAAERQRLAERARALRAAQATPDPPAALARLPRLEPHQVPRAVRRLPTEMREHAGVPILEHPVFANGMVYLGLAFDTAELEEELVALLPLFGLATTEMGAAGLDYEQMARRIQRYTGGVWSELVAGAEVHTGAPRERLLIDGKALAHNGHQLVAIVRDLVGAPDPHDAKRLGDLVREAHARAEAALIPRGTRLAILRAARGLGRRFRRREQWAGVSQLLFLRALAATLAEELPQLIERLETLGRRLLVRQRLLVSVAGDPQSIAALRAEIDALIEALPAAGGGSGAVAPDGRGPAGTAASGPVAAGAERAATEGIAIASEVAFAARLLPVAPITSEAAPALELLAHVLSLDYLYQRIRVQGGAYGGWCQYGQEDGVLVMASYRDPHLEETLQVFDGVWAFARERLDDAALEAVRLGALAPGLRPPSPAEVLSTARRRWLLGIDDELRQRLRDGLFELDAAAVRRLALPVLEQGLAAAGTAALAARERLLAAARALQLPLTITEAS